MDDESVKIDNQDSGEISDLEEMKENLNEESWRNERKFKWRKPRKQN